MRILERPLSKTDIVWNIDRYSHFHDMLHVSGFAFCPGRQIATIKLRLGDGRAVDFPRWNLPSPDLARIHGNEAAACRFDELLPVGPDAVPLLNASLSVVYTDGGTGSIPLCTGDSTDTSGALMERFFAMLAEKPSGHLIEVGSRARSGTVYRSRLPPGWQYTGFDIADGPNVDVVGDAHRASQFLPNNAFDAMMSFVVFEHLMMPWKAVIEINRLLRVGAVGIVLAPQAWTLHEEPCDYFRFSKHAWKSLFNKATGFEIIEAVHGGRAYLVAHNMMPASMFTEVHTCALMAGVIFRKISETTLDWPVDMSEFSDDIYPF